MDAFQNALSVLLGGGLTLLGTLLANLLQHHAQVRDRRRETTVERLSEIRRFIQACLEFADIAYRPKRLGPQLFGPEQTKAWVLELTEELQRWRGLPVKGSARALYTDNHPLLDLLGKLDSLTFLFYLNAKIAYEEGRMADIDDKLRELQDVASEASRTVDELMRAA